MFLLTIILILILSGICVATGELERLMQRPYTFEVIDDELVAYQIYSHKIEDAPQEVFTPEDFHQV